VRGRAPGAGAPGRREWRPRDHLASLDVNEPPAWLRPLPDAETMRRIDRWAIEQRRIPSLDLMERAGAGVARAVEALTSDGEVAVLCGKGNNGGDGLVTARLLREAGRDVTVACTAALDELAGDARVNLERLPGEAPVVYDEQARVAVGRSAAIVDALLGTGFHGEPTGSVADAIDAINTAGAPVVSVDVPSGVDASSGAVASVAVRASVTTTFHAAKPGLWVNPGKAHAGRVEVVDIGIPHGAPGDARTALLSAAVLATLPRRGAASTKFVSGHVLVVGGSRGMIGAARMAALAAMRAGAGYVTACVPDARQDVLASGGPPELMTRALPEGDALTEDGAAVVLADTERGGALALGPGLGRDERSLELARVLAREARVALVLDADGLNAHAGRLRTLRDRQQPTVLTPHAGELARLMELDSAAIERERLHHVREAAVEADAIVVLKGDDTLIAAPDGQVAVSPGQSPALATAGTGDALTGVLGALLSQGLEPFTAASAGVWLHAAAGREAARRVGSAEGVIATDVIAALGAVRSEHGAPGASASGNGRL
jgi:ADP-dependent NAD(P)H-hydrate dehydratase / NAD(P)H-hydrate epimerase